MLDFKTGCLDWKKVEGHVADYSKKDEAYFFKMLDEDYTDATKTVWRKKLSANDKDGAIEIWQRPSEDQDHLVRIHMTTYGISM